MSGNLWFHVRSGADSLEWFALTLGMLGVAFVHEPAQLVEHVRALAGRFRRSTPAGTGPMA